MVSHAAIFLNLIKVIFMCLVDRNSGVVCHQVLLCSMNLICSSLQWGRDSSVGVATGYGLEGPGIESLWRRVFHTCPDRHWGPPSLLSNGYRVFLGGKAAGTWC
jgi:hypothetical protein